MQWFYVSENQQRGPLDDAQLRGLVEAGEVGPDTLVWRNGMADWQPARQVRPEDFSAGGVRMPSTEREAAVCAECRQTFLRSEMVQINQNWVCAGCKPIYLQRLGEGVAPLATGAIWRSGHRIVMRSETAMPDLCVRCNAPAHGYRLKRTLHWHSPLWYLLILISLLIYIIVALCVRKKAVLHIGLCERHRRRRIAFMIVGWLGVFAGVVLLIQGLSGTGSGELALGGFILLLAAAITGIAGSAVVSAAKIDKDIVWVKGAGSEFRSNLPEWMGPD